MKQPIQTVPYPSSLRIYDNGGKTFDRYTVYFLAETNPRNGLVSCLGMSDNPGHPQGFGQHSEGKPGGHNGKRIAFTDLPKDCQQAVMRDLSE